MLTINRSAPVSRGPENSVRRVGRSGLLVASALLIAPLFALFPLNDGDTLGNVTIRDASDHPAVIPDMGTKIVSILYTDPDVADQNDPFADALKAAHLPKSRFRGMGIVNMKDAPWKPDSIIRMIVRRKIEKYDATILTDPNHVLKNAWHLGECDDKSVVIILDKSRKVIFFKKGALNPAEIQQTVAMIEKMTRE